MHKEKAEHCGQYLYPEDGSMCSTAMLPNTLTLHCLKKLPPSVDYCHSTDCAYILNRYCPLDLLNCECLQRGTGSD